MEPKQMRSPFAVALLIDKSAPASTATPTKATTVPKTSRLVTLSPINGQRRNGKTAGTMLTMSDALATSVERAPTTQVTK